MVQIDRSVIEANVALARRFIEDIFGAANPNSFDEIVADDIRVLSVLKPEGWIEGKAEYADVLGRTVSGQFSDFHIKVEDVVGTLDGRVVARLWLSGTHVGPLFGIPPTNRRIDHHVLQLMRFRDGKLVELISGSLNPLQFEMLVAPAIAKRILGDG